ncbi:MAG: 4'-phosphopantetheinyl transferase superfamily protein [Bacteroidales bacterium]|nr:4'-phosphopantetheinyl transferase superfamily protein [Bacteroidales bacterium]
MWKSYLFEHPENITPQQLEQELLPALPAWRREQTLAFKHLDAQVLSASAFLLLQNGLRNDFGVKEPLHFDYLEHGKPLLREHPELHFSLSHCSKGALCVIDDSGPVGCDIEALDRKISDALMERCCSEEELSAIRGAAVPTHAFIRLWTMKEAALKLTGEGLTPHLATLLTAERQATLVFYTRIFEEKGYAFSIVHHH